MAGPLVPIGPMDPFKGIPIVDLHLYGSAGSLFVSGPLFQGFLSVAVPSLSGTGALFLKFGSLDLRRSRSSSL